jgi:hypothetical protein
MACMSIDFKQAKIFSFCKTTFFKPSSFELFYLGLVFVIDKNVVVVGNTHNVQLGGLHDMVTSFFLLWCLCHMFIHEIFDVLKTFHPNIIKDIHTSYKHPHKPTLKPTTMMLKIIMNFRMQTRHDFKFDFPFWSVEFKNK